MRFNTNPPNWKIIIGVISIVLVNLFDMLTRMGRLPETPYEIVMIIIPILILVFIFLEKEVPGENPIV